METFINIILTIITFVIGFGLMIFLHELGHFFFAKKFNVLCQEFAIGMGPLIFKKEKGETKYSLRAIPIGGFVSMAGEAMNNSLLKKGQRIGIRLNENGQIKEILLDNFENEINGEVVNYDLYDKEKKGLFLTLNSGIGEKTYVCLDNTLYKYNDKKTQISTYERSLESKKVWKRMIIILAGPIMNFLFAFLLFFIIGLANGKPQNSNVLGKVVGNTPASQILQKGDKVTKIGNYAVTDWNSIANALYTTYDENNGNKILITYERNGIVETNYIEQPLIVLFSLGIANYDENYVARNNDDVTVSQIAGENAKKAGLQKGDKVLNIELDGVSHTITNWYDLYIIVKDASDGTKVKLTIDRKGIKETISYELWEDQVLKTQGYNRYSFTLGINPNYKFDFLFSLKRGVLGIKESVMSVVNTFRVIFSSSQVGINNLSGPIGIFTALSQVVKNGILPILSFIAFLSVNLGVINLIPIPALDGGRFVLLAVEGITRKPVNKKIENGLITITFILIMMLFVYVAFNDVLRLF